jgi:hypothetical protein
LDFVNGFVTLLCAWLAFERRSCHLKHDFVAECRSG